MGVEDYHTYYVGDDIILVHNDCGYPKSSNKYKNNQLDYHAIKKEYLWDTKIVSFNLYIDKSTGLIWIKYEKYNTWNSTFLTVEELLEEFGKWRIIIK